MQLSSKQAENVRLAHRRWNVCEGAVRSGKSWLACNYTIPDRVLKLAGLPGISLILGVSLGNIERNVLQPMRETYGPELVSTIKGSENTASLFGQKVYCLGAEKKGQVAKLQGAAVKFCYCDELAALSPDVFDMLKSRLSFDYSECHASCNPEGPRHWLKRFLDTAPGVYRQRYTIDDNPFLPKSFIDALKAEYAGTVYEDRYIRGLWAQAEGLVYPHFRDAVEETWQGDAQRIAISMDYGTLNATACIMWAQDVQGAWHAVAEYYYSGRDEGRQKTDLEYAEDIAEWAASVVPGFQGKLKIAVDPSAASMQEQLRRTGLFRVVDADNAVLTGIETVSAALQAGAVKVGDSLTHALEEADGYVWDDRGEGQQERPVKVADHCMDALRYGVMTFGMYNPRRWHIEREGE